MADNSNLLTRLDAQVLARPDDADLRYLRAGALVEAGRSDEARADYLAVVAARPDHFGALNDLGTLLYNTDYRGGARLAYAEAVKHHPDNPIGRINLANALLNEGRYDEAREHYETALGLAPDHPEAHQGMANLLSELGEAEAAAHHLAISVKDRGITTLPFRGTGTPPRVLLLVSAAGGNVPTKHLLDDTLFATSILAVEAHRPGAPLPLHDLVFNAVGDADLCGAALDAAEQVLTRTTAPAINPPDRVRATGRAAIARRLADLPGVVTPRVAAVPRETVEETARDFDYPLLLRSPGFHTGRHFVKIDRPDDLAAGVAALPGRELLLIQYLDARDARGRARKFRVMMIGGEIFPLHLAVSNAWKVHYFTADMAEAPAHRTEEAAFLQDMGGVLGPRAMAGLAAISQRLGLDYAGADFGLSAKGDILLFEANATMVVNPPDTDARWDYRREAVERVLQAVRRMLRARAAYPSSAMPIE